MTTPSGILGGLLDSPRKQRRFFIFSAAVLVVGVAVFISLVVFRGTSNAFTDTISNKPAALYHPDKTAKFSSEERQIAREFIRTAVLRQDLDAAYAIAHPDIKGGLTRKQWDTGAIPVVFYPARNWDTAAMVIDYSYRTSALIEVDLVAKKGADQRPHLLFYLGLKRAGNKPDGRWLVNYWQPHWKPPVPSAVG
jgi:hypothetical protein